MTMQIDDLLSETPPLRISPFLMLPLRDKAKAERDIARERQRSEIQRPAQ